VRPTTKYKYRKNSLLRYEKLNEAGTGSTAKKTTIKIFGQVKWVIK
jgi:hypothetical protein